MTKRSKKRDNAFSGRVRKVIFLTRPYILGDGVKGDFGDGTPKITVKGDVGQVNEGDEFEFEGQVVNNPRYGFEFDFSGFVHQLPHDAKELAALTQEEQRGGQ